MHIIFKRHIILQVLYAIGFTAITETKCTRFKVRSLIYIFLIKKWKIKIYFKCKGGTGEKEIPLSPSWEKSSASWGLLESQVPFMFLLYHFLKCFLCLYSQKWLTTASTLRQRKRGRSWRQIASFQGCVLFFHIHIISAHIQEAVSCLHSF